MCTSELPIQVLPHPLLLSFQGSRANDIAMGRNISDASFHLLYFPPLVLGSPCNLIVVLVRFPPLRLLFRIEPPVGTFGYL